MIEKKPIIELLTGVKSSKRSYYTELKKTIEQLERKNMKLEIINEVMKSFKVDMSMDEMLENVMKKLEKLYKVDRLSLSIYENKQLILTNVYPVDSFFLKLGEVLPEQDSLYYKAVYSREALFHSVKNPNELSNIEQATIQTLNIKSLFVFPLLSKNSVSGILSLGSNEIVEFDERDVTFLQQLADQLAVCIENSRLYHAVLHGKKEWEETFRAVEDLLIFVDMDYRIIRFNDAVKSFYQINDDSLYGQSIKDVITYKASKSTTICPIDESYHTREVANQQLHLTNGKIVDAYTYPVYNEDSEMYGVIVYMKDVTKKVYTEAQLLHSGKLAAIGELAAGVAHELNSPLTAIIGNAQLLMRDFDKDNMSYQLLSDIYNCGDRSKNIIRNLLTFSRQDENDVQGCSLNQAIKHVLSLIRFQVERQCITIETKLCEGLPEAKGSIQQIEQIVINLVINARDAIEQTENEKKLIKIETGQKQINKKEWLYLSVEDNGIGISEDYMKEIFRPFFTTKEAIQGTGLGLSVSLGIAKEHGGTIEVNSEEGKGSRFTLLIPKM
ncbi:sensor histidine kinase [Bacillus sp. FJAT-45350]|uniref:sensor histidine kinase n=1 Tax=Bacillus sp. FJAT-45350 TaxID=2011014 RepID=UPI000BB8A425|nr:ATP-binding protein [Bacillus sp. FJAT-45350]